MRLIQRLLRRFLVLCLGIFTVWLIVFVILDTSEARLPWILAVSLTYAMAAYVILPRVVRMSMKLLQRQLIPGFTITGDGLPGDPVNIVLIGTAQQLHEAFATAGWFTADELGVASSWRMIRAFVLNASYPTAPFSSLYLFGRRQDFGFQEPIGDSPRKRHHIRFWALSLARSADDVATAGFWLNTDKPPIDEPVLWVGAGTRDTGLSLTRMTFQITHATDSDTSSEREYILGSLKSSGVIGETALHKSGERLGEKRVNHYTTDGEIAFASLVGTSGRGSGGRQDTDPAGTAGEPATKALLSVTAVFEALTGLALLAVPAVLVEYLLGVPPGDAAGLTASRIAGAALLALGVACWLARNDGASRAAKGLIAAMLLYNVGVVAVLLHAWTSLGLSGVALWPAILAHMALAAWCVERLVAGSPAASG